MKALAPALALLLAACGPDEATPSASASLQARALQAKDGGISAEVNRRCQAFGSSASVSFTPGLLCPRCTAADTAQAVDGADETVASLDAGQAEPGSLGLRAVAPAGVVYPAGSNATVTLSASDVTTHTGPLTFSGTRSWLLTIRTYLGAAVQDEDSGYVSLDDDASSRHVAGLSATRPFDSIEAVFDRSGIQADPSGAAVGVNGTDYISNGNVQVHEFCADFDLDGL